VIVTKKMCRATHEAGHAVAAQHAQGFVVTRISIEDSLLHGETIKGSCEYERPGLTPDVIRSDMSVSLAGCLAVAKLRGLNMPRDSQGVLDWLGKTSAIDAKQFSYGLNDLSRLCDLEKDRVCEEVFQLTENILDQNWSALITLAEILKDILPTLEGAALADVLRLLA
jgi:hypothetical protein